MKKITLITGNIVYLVMLNDKPIGQIKIVNLESAISQLKSKGFNITIK